MSQKNLDRRGRWRTRNVGFKVSPEEAEWIDTAVRLSGLTKQEYIIRKLRNLDVVVQGNPRVYKALRNTMQDILTELLRIKDASEITPEMQDLLILISNIMNGMKEETV